MWIGQRHLNQCNKAYPSYILCCNIMLKHEHLKWTIYGTRNLKDKLLELSATTTIWYCSTILKHFSLLQSILWTARDVTRRWSISLFDRFSPSLCSSMFPLLFIAIPFPAALDVECNLTLFFEQGFSVLSEPRPLDRDKNEDISSRMWSCTCRNFTYLLAYSSIVSISNLDFKAISFSRERFFPRIFLQRWCATMLWGSTKRRLVESQYNWNLSCFWSTKFIFIKGEWEETEILWDDKLKCNSNRVAIGEILLCKFSSLPNHHDYGCVAFHIYHPNATVVVTCPPRDEGDMEKSHCKVNLPRTNVTYGIETREEGTLLTLTRRNYLEGVVG